jgi:hypothetical protein
MNTHKWNLQWYVSDAINKIYGGGEEAVSFPKGQDI